MIPRMLALMGGDESLSGPRQRSPHRSDRKTGLRGNLRVAEPCIPQ